MWRNSLRSFRHIGSAAFNKLTTKTIPMKANESKIFKILTIDGGGIKGLYSASILARIEEKTGKKIGDHFDMICGTSTGGLIALALSKGISAQEIADMYFNEGSKIFPVSENKLIRYAQRKWQFFKQLLWKGKFSAEPLRTILERLFGETTMGEANNLLCIPSYNLSSINI